MRTTTTTAGMPRVDYATTLLAGVNMNEYDRRNAERDIRNAERMVELAGRVIDGSKSLARFVRAGFGMPAKAAQH